MVRSVFVTFVPLNQGQFIKFGKYLTIDFGIPVFPIVQLKMRLEVVP